MVRLRLTLFLVAGIAFAVSAHAQDAVHFDLTLLFNADVVVNNGTGTLDPDNDPIDLGTGPSNNFAFPTQSVADATAPVTPDGIPDDGLIAGSPAGVPIQLAYNNDDDGLNAVRLEAVSGTFGFDVPIDTYEEVHVFATTGDGTSDITVTLEYTDGTTDQHSGVIPDWFDDPPASPDRYRLVDGRDRMNPGVPPGVPYAYEESDDPAIFGFVVIADLDKELEAVSIERTDNTGVLNVFGASGLRVPTCCSPCELIALLEPLDVLRPAPPDYPCSLLPPAPPSGDCCETFDLLVPRLPGKPRIASSHPCAQP